MADELVKTLELASGNPGAGVRTLWFEDQPPAVVFGYLSPHLDFQAVTRELRAALPASTTFVATTTAGELYSRADGALYCAVPNAWSRIVLLALSPRLVCQVHSAFVPLRNADLRTGTVQMPLEQRVKAMSRDLEAISLPFPVDAKDTFAYTLIDGVSLVENAFMEAVYRSHNFPFLMIGGSSGGTLDFQKTLLSDGKNCRENHALITVIKVAPEFRFGVFRSQNFQKTDASFVVLAGRTEFREVSYVLDPETADKIPITDALARLLRCRKEELAAKMSDRAFGIEIAGRVYVRSVASIDVDHDVVRFYCDVEVGDRLHLLTKTDFVETTKADWQTYLRNKPAPVGGILNDCILRRLNNGKDLHRVRLFDSVPVAGFSTFGELIGLNVNETLTSVFFHRVEPGQTFKDDYVDHFVVHYADFQASFFERRVTRDSILSSFHNRMLAEVFQAQAVVGQLIESFLKIRGVMAHDSSTLRALLDHLSQFSTAIEQNADAGNHILVQIAKLSERLKDINSISETVNDVAERTGVLSINASIQAARAGDAGKAFAVVASEVRNLSAQTLEHVKAITHTSDSIVAAVHGIHQGSQDANQLFTAMLRSNQEVQSQIGSVSKSVDSSMQLLDTGQRLVDDIGQYQHSIRHVEELLKLVAH